MVALVTLIFSILVLYLIYRYLIAIYDYWRKKNVPGPKPVFLFGNILEVAIQRKTFTEVITSCYNDYPEENFVGLFQGRTPVLLVRDVSQIKRVLIRDFPNFHNRGILMVNSPLSKSLFHAENETWLLLRQKLTPIFTSGKLKNMFHLMNDCAVQFQQYLEHLVQTNAEPEMRQLMAKFTLEVFGSCVFGIDMGTLSDDENVFRNVGANMFRPRLKISAALFLDTIFPGIVKKLNVTLHKPDVFEFFVNLVRKLIKEREGKPKIRKDFMDLLLELREHGYITGGGFDEDQHFDLEVTEELMAVQAIVFYAAGFESSSGTMSFLLYELALNADIQEKVYEEVCSVVEKYNGILTYEGIQEMTYLDMVMAETLRKYPLGGVLIRESSNDYTFPGTTVTIEKGTKILIPVDALQNDSQYFENPDIFNPERFSPQKRRMITQSTYLAFGEGPRNCIGMRFAKAQTMVGVASFLQKYRVVPSAKTKQKLKFNPLTITLESIDGIWMKILKR